MQKFKNLTFSSRH